MARARIAFAPRGLPRMLQTILRETLQGVPDVEIVPAEDLKAGDRVAALITADPIAAADALRSDFAVRAVSISPDGNEAKLFLPGQPVQKIDDVSPGTLLRALGLAKTSTGWFMRVFGRHRYKTPDDDRQLSFGQPSASLPYRSHLAMFVGRILMARGQEHATNGPAAELAGLIHELAGRAGPEERLPNGLTHIKQLFHLGEIETALLFLAALVEVDPLAARLMGLLNDHMGKLRPMLGLAADLGGSPAAIARRFEADGPFARYDLARLDGEGPLVARSIVIPADLWPLLLDLNRKPPFSVVDVRGLGFAALPLPDGAAAGYERIAAGLAPWTMNLPIIVVSGDAGCGRSEIAKGFAARLCSSAITTRAPEVADAVGRLAREAAVLESAVILTDAETLSPDLWRTLTRDIGVPLLVTATANAVPRLAQEASYPVFKVEGPRRDLAQRSRLWQAASPDTWEHSEITSLAERFDVGRDGICAAMGLARLQASADGRSEVAVADARAACETLRDVRFQGMAQALPCPYLASDIVLRPEVKAEIDLVIAWARHGSRLFGSDGPARALNAGGGLACLFSGPPGTGKTMAAQIIAREVDYALYRIDLSQVVDKYIGESEKRLSVILDEAERSRVGLFCDEADWAFGKRTELHDSHDRYANTTVDFLLQRLETFSGLIILATNLPGNIDDAFLRRMQIRAEFTKPDAADRRRIWERLLPIKRDSDFDLDLLSGSFDLTGGEIRNAVFAAHLLAAKHEEQLSMRHCAMALWREISKIGRLANADDFGLWAKFIQTG
jgi:hypothetical protein